MSGAELLAERVLPIAETTWRALALNGKGIARAASAGFTDITLVVSASAEHSRANAGRNPAEAIADFAPAVAAHPAVRFSGGVSTAFVCPFAGSIPSRAVVEIAEAYADIGIERIGLADTIGTAEPDAVESIVKQLKRSMPTAEISLHLHNAHGRAFETVDRAIAAGVRQFDSSTGGYGGCPFAPGAHGNIATEDLVAHLHELGLSTDIDLEGVNFAKSLIAEVLARGTPVAV